ncbi:Spo0E family sporulation regulatory protein-aspartic acid phosphatase [Peribacillus asahii]|nr:Spo0E family sporulation regulatory protein-aspartic acid phosphatase [Peribacillus asahii]
MSIEGYRQEMYDLAKETGRNNQEVLRISQ